MFEQSDASADINERSRTAQNFGVTLAHRLTAFAPLITRIAVITPCVIRVAYGGAIAFAAAHSSAPVFCGDRRTGLTCTGELATLNLRHQIPVFLIVSQRGSIDDHRIYQEVQGRRTIPLLQTYDFPYHIVNEPDEISTIPDAYETCRLQKRPFVLFLTRNLVKGDAA